MAGRVRGFETVGDMVRSLAVVGVFVGVILLITLRQTPDKIQRVDPTEVVAAVEQAAPFAATVPGPTPAGWTPTSARVSLPTDRPYSWYVGYSTDKEAFVALTQIYGDPDAGLIEAGVPQGKGTEDGTVVIGGKTWKKYEAADGTRRALVLTEGQVTTVVVGTAPYPVLEASAAALTPAKRS